LATVTSPQETLAATVSFADMDLVEHFSNVSTKRDWTFPEAEQDGWQRTEEINDFTADG